MPASSNFISSRILDEFVDVLENTRVCFDDLRDAMGSVIATTRIEKNHKQSHKAQTLLKHFLPPSKWQQFKSKGYFICKSKGHTWKFINREHYPLEYDGKQICIDGDPQAPVEDLLLQCYLEVKGGRGDGLIVPQNRSIVPRGETEVTICGFLPSSWILGEEFPTQLEILYMDGKLHVQGIGLIAEVIYYSEGCYRAKIHIREIEAEQYSNVRDIRPPGRIRVGGSSRWHTIECWEYT